VASDRWEDGTAAVEVGLERLLVNCCGNKTEKRLTSW
jgi:hypothetical protein